METRTQRTCHLVTLLLCIMPALTLAQQPDAGPMYVTVDCMKSTAADYVLVETDIWQPMHQELVHQGKRNSWALYSVEYGNRSKCDFYTVTTYLGEKQLNADPGYDTAFKAVHDNKNFSKEMAKTMASRERVSTELWMYIDGTEINDHRFVVVNMMYADDPDVYEKMESEVFKPGHQALVDGGHRAGWSIYTLISPLGTSIPYNYSTVDFVNELGPAPMAESMMMANPDRDLEEMHKMLELREHVSSEIWALVATTN